MCHRGVLAGKKKKARRKQVERKTRKEGRRKKERREEGQEKRAVGSFQSTRNATMDASRLRVSRDKTKLAELLTEHNDPNEGNEIGERPLHLAALSGHKECCELLLENGADSGATTLKRQTPLHHAAIGGKVDCISLLLEHGVDPDSTDGRGWTALHYAVENSRIDCVRNLLEGGADASPQTTSNLHQSGQHLQTTPLHLACSKGNLEIVLLLIRNGARIDVKDSNGEYPLSLLPVASPSGTSSVAKTTNINETWKQRHTQQLAHNVSSLFNSSKYSDATITMQDKVIPLHRCILYFQSDRLQTLLKDDATALVEDELTYEGFLGMVEYLYREVWMHSTQSSTRRRLAKTRNHR